MRYRWGTPPGSRLHRWRHVAWVVALAGGLAVVLPKRADPGPDRFAALAQALEKRGIVAAPSDIQWVDDPRSSLGGTSRAIVRAAPSKGDPNDIFVVRTRLTPEGVLLEAGESWNLTDTSGADESRPIVRGERIAYVAKPLVGAPTIHVLDLGGQDSPNEWTKLERSQNALTNLQQTGQLRGVSKRTFGLEDEAEARKGAPGAAPGTTPAAEGADEPAHAGAASGAKPAERKDVEVAIDLADPAGPPSALGPRARGSILVIRSGGRTATIDLAEATPHVPPWIRTENAELSRPGNVTTWAVDRVRHEVGDDAMQYVKAIAFTGLDVILRNKEKVSGDTGAEDIAKDLGKTELDPPVRTIPSDPDLGWPPAPLEAWVVPALPGEGQWNVLDKDPFVRRNEGLPPAFLTTYIRTDRERKAVRTYIALWDPRQIELHMMAGTVEPKGATGEAGPGLIPRTPEVMKRVVAASNAGFQALHGEFGMMADGVVYLPPKPYAATVAVLRDGTTGFGSWPADTTIPEQILSYRQNMTVMVQDEKFNPYNRTWWGGTPPGWADKTHTVRTGICQTKERFIAYFYGADLSPDALAQAMIQARCAFGLALDMNSGHSGLEFYKVAPADQFEPLKQPLSYDWQNEGDVPGLDGWKFRARRLIRGMGLMNFPRYIKREARDFFYMTLRHVLPGAALTPVLVKSPQAGEGEWRLKGLPQHGFPYALALTELRPDASRPDLKLRVLQMDPRTVAASKSTGSTGSTAGKTVAVIDAGEKPAGDAPSLWYSTGAFSIGPTAPVADATRMASGLAPGKAGGAAIGVTDEGGMLLYLEVIAGGDAAKPEADGKILDELLKKLGCSTRLSLGKPLGVILGGDTDLAGTATRAPSGPTAVRLARVEAAGAKRIFEDTPVVPYDTWYPLQQKRIRYFKHAADAPPADDAN